MTPYYEHGGVTIFHSDVSDALSCIAPGSVNVVVTSPPYNQMHSYNGPPSGMYKQTRAGRGFIESWQKSGYSDNMPEHAYQAWQVDLFATCKTLCANDASLFYVCQIRWRAGVCLHPVSWFSPEGWALRQEIIWNRGGGMMFNARMFVRFDERILWFVRGDKWKWNQALVGLGTIWQIARMQQQQGKEHPVEFPVEIPQRCIAATTDAGDTVLDPFMGAGSTLLAAKALGRRAIGVEIDERYCEIAARRLSQDVLPLAPRSPDADRPQGLPFAGGE